MNLGPLKSPMPEQYSDEEWTALIDQQQHQANMECMFQVDALLQADWKFELTEDERELWQWKWRRPPRRKGSKGRLFLSTNQAYSALMRERANS